MTSKAHVEFDPTSFGVRVAIRRDLGERLQFLQWPDSLDVIEVPRGVAAPDEGLWLRLGEEDTRALYDALADHFGHAGHDARALRRDYEAERKRVDLLIDRMAPR